MATARRIGSRNYVRGKNEPIPTQFVEPAKEGSNNTFRDYDGREYVIVWPRGRMLLSELGGSNAEK